jgi:hypothetical protein
MAKLPNLKLSESEVSQTFDLKEILGVDVRDYPEVKDAIGEAIIQKIIDRTESGVDVSGKKFKNYSDEYVGSLPFKAFGKSANDVNLTQTGAMLGTIDIIQDKGNKIKIGWEDPTENAKAYNHNAGDTVKKREFFGLTAADLKSISAEFKPDLRKSVNDEVLLSKLDKIADFILSDDE